MSGQTLKLSPKYKTFLRTQAKAEFLEGTTYAGKTTVGLFKFFLQIAASPKKYHIIAAKDIGTAEKNLINKDLGIIDIFGVLTVYNGNGTADEKIPHILYKPRNGEKVVYVMGYGDKKKWQKALGGQYGCLYIDEINTADIEFVREAAMRCDYLMATLNPDNPDLPIYSDYINHARPLPQYADDAPGELLEMLRETPKDGWVWWYFSFDHNAGLSAEKRAQIIENVPAGTKIHKNKILGLRGRATGLVFSNFERGRHVVTESQAKEFIRRQGDRKQTEYFVRFSAGLDTSYSTRSADTIAMSYIGITNRRRCVLLEERIYNNAKLAVPVAPSDTAANFAAFLERCGKKWGYCRNVFIDSADQATITELNKYKRQHGVIYTFNSAWKKTTIIDRINLQLGWFAHDEFLVAESCREYMSELEIYSWLEDKDNTPEDGNDHMINSVQYAWLPYKTMIGTGDR